MGAMSFRGKVVRWFALLGSSVLIYICLNIAMTSRRSSSRDLERLLTLRDFWPNPTVQPPSVEPPVLSGSPEKPPKEALAPSGTTEAGREPPEALSVLLLSSMPRGGSTLLAEILSLRPESVLFFEPLWHLQKKEEECFADGRCVTGRLHRLFNCSFEPRFEAWLKSKKVFLTYFSAEAKECLSSSSSSSSCVRALDLREACLASPFRIAKVVRARLSWVERLVSDPLLNLKVLHLVRDPRASLASIARFRGWNRNPHDRCAGLEEDLEAFDGLSSRYPSRVLQVKHEDLCLDPEAAVGRIHSFLYGSPLLPGAVEEYLGAHMAQGSRKGAMSTYKDSRKEFEAWRYRISSQMLKNVEGEPACLRSIRRMNHTVFGSLERARNSTISLFARN